MQSAVAAAISMSLIMNQQSYSSGSSTHFPAYCPSPEDIKRREEAARQAALHQQQAAKAARQAEAKKRTLIKRFERHLLNATSPDTLEMLLMIQEFCAYLKERPLQQTFLTALFKNTSLTPLQLQQCVQRLLQTKSLSIDAFIFSRQQFTCLQKLPDWQTLLVNHYLQWLPDHYDQDLVCQQDAWKAAITLDKGKDIMQCYAAPLAHPFRYVSFPGQLRDFYTYWLSTLENTGQVRQVDSAIQPQFSGDMAKILHELAQVRLLELTAAETKPDAPDQSGARNQDEDNFMKNTRFRIPCFSRLTSVPTLFNQAKRHDNIATGLENRKMEIEQEFAEAQDAFEITKVTL